MTVSFDRDKMLDQYGLNEKFATRYGWSDMELMQRLNELKRHSSMVVRHWSDVWSANIEANVATAAASGRQWRSIEELYGTLNGTAVLCGAGPSLTRNMKIVQKVALNERVFVAAVDRAYPVLQERGVRVDLVVTADAKEVVAEWLRDCEAPVAVAPVTHPKAIEAVSGEVYMYMPCALNTTFWTWAAEKFRIKANVMDGNIVSYVAVIILVFMGVDSVYTIGNDLCYYSRKEWQRSPNKEISVRQVGNLLVPEPFYRSAMNFRSLPMMFEDVEFVDVSGGMRKADWKTAEPQALLKL